MKRLLIIFLILFFSQNISVNAEEIYTTSNLKVYSLNNRYGLKDQSDKVIVYAQYKKLIRLGDSAWIIQKKNNRFGLIDCNGKILVPPKYLHVERIFDKWVKLGNEKDYGLYDEFGTIIIPPEYTSIEPLFGNRFLTCKHYKYGIYNSKGKKLLDNEYDFIYTPSPKVIRIQYHGNWYEIESISQEEAINLPKDIVKVKFDDKDYKVTELLIKTGVGAGYSVVTATDYLLKTISTISTAYEDTIDDLMLSKGAETVSIFIKLSWLPKFPIVFAKKYYNNLFSPNNGPLSGIRNDLKSQMK